MSSRMATTKKSTSRRGKGLPRRAQDLSKEELLLTLQKKRECNAKALKIVEGMLEPDVKEDWFLDVLQHINQSHLLDIIEERAITKLCGYPLCSNELKDIPSQQYRISTKLNKVYDIKERKNFCSNNCFKAYKFIRDQMHTSPLWLRDIEPVIKFSLMPSSESGEGAGDEVNVQVERVTKEEIKQLSGEELKTSSSTSQKSLADVLHDLHTVTALRAEKTSKLQELFVNDKQNVDNEEETACVAIEKPISKVKENTKSSSKYAEKIRVKEEETCTITQDTTNSICPDVNLNTMKSGEILSGVEEISINELSDRKNICQKSIASARIECSKKLADDNSIHPVHKVDKKQKEQIIPQRDVLNSVDMEGDSVKSEEIATGYKPSVPEEGENQRKFESKAVLKAERTQHFSEKKVRQQQVNSSFPHHKLPSIVSHVEKCLEEWFTMDTMCFLFGETALKDMLEQKGESIQAHYNALGTVTWDQEKHERFLAICKRLSLLDIEDSNFDNQVRNEAEKRKPLPDYNAIKKEAETMELKIKAFYSGNMEMEEKKVSFAKDTISDGNNIDECQSQIPLVHIHSQRALRKKIVLNGLNRVLPDFLRTFGLRPSEMTASIRGLVGTFALSSTNITFKPQEWSLLGLIVIKLLALREPELKHCLQLEQSNTYLTLMLMSYKQEPGYLEHLLSWLTDIDKLLARPKVPEEQI
ncbi:putative RNA polymerase II subunit B1 CTD phosphatase RPAP2 [Thrips palmi]|uniref:RNA polymerase II subunit B1 CTD phosphatase RPAP2 homolog n=1 Tax=Thrips palmi TaxID=161013 RepID=A0A6P9AEY3_THRPL|nr:putative RNA polymerase II subunit B1 CTD phosphatase RPAP2 [Thrips palmi]XP_034256030.1 putative RNA polymerase II subunit B1 CTD phosphatase RPAP2 [Thrips palmi]